MHSRAHQLISTSSSASTPSDSYPIINQGELLNYDLCLLRPAASGPGDDGGGIQELDLLVRRGPRRDHQPGGAPGSCPEHEGVTRVVEGLRGDEGGRPEPQRPRRQRGGVREAGDLRAAASAHEDQPK